MVEKREDGVKIFHAKDVAAWRQWLSEHHDKEHSLWLIIYKKDSGIPTVYYDEAVDEALCFGWVDSKVNKRDGESYFQYFAKRNPKSNWSRVNKEKVEKLQATGKMEAAGEEMIAIAKASGTWTALDDVENLVIPKDLAAEFDKYDTAADNFNAFPRSVKRGILEWLFNAKQAATRQKRTKEIANKASKNIRANQYEPK